MMSFDEWLDELSYTEFKDELFYRHAPAGTRPYAAEIEEMLAPDRGISASAVFCVGDFPTICFIDAATLTQDREIRIAQIRQRVWNQNLASVVLVLDKETLSAYSVNDRDAPPDVVTRSSAGERGHWSAYEVQSGFIKDRLSDWFSPEERVDQRLLANLRQVVRRLTKEGLSGTQAEALMAQVIFLCYLEQRGIVGEAYRAKHKLDDLASYVSSEDGAGVDRLLSQLSSDFNGDFLSSKDGGAPLWATLNKHSYRYINQFLEAVDFETGQGAFWRYDFSRIPVELISGIYETFLKDRQGKLGAYYTPRHLANLVTEQALQSFSDPTKCTVYDGACGSGILLTTAFRKMIRHAEVSGNRKLRFSERVALLRRNLFGSDIDETACWITAFSLYLSLLEGLALEDIELLQTDYNSRLPQIIGEGRNIEKGEHRGDFFSEENPFPNSRRFDVLLSNPPWRESDDEEQPSWEAWCRKQQRSYPIGRRQIAAGFAYGASQSVKSSGVITLIMPLNLIIGASSQSCEFRRRWLEDVKIERIINFADVRRLLFPAAKHPCAVVRVRPRGDGDIALSSESIEYLTPKTDVSLALGRLALHAVDRKIISAREVYEQPYSLITSYWGDRRDKDLLRRLQRFGSLKETMEARTTPWISGKGFHAPNKSNVDRELGLLKGLSYSPADRVPLSHPVIGKDTDLKSVREDFSIVASPGGRNGRLYIGPRVIFTDGLTEDFCIRAAFTNVKFAFTSSVGAIGGSKTDSDLLMFLAVYLRSSLAVYLLIMTGYSVIGERPRVAVDDIEGFPFCAPDSHPKPEVATRIVREVATIMEKLTEVPEFLRDQAYASEKSKLNKLIFDYFGFNKTERVVVNDTVQFISTSIQPPDYERIKTPLLERPTNPEINKYLDALLGELVDWRGRTHGSGALNIEAKLDGTSGFFGVVRVSVSQGSNDSKNLSTSESAFRGVLTDVQAGLEAQLTAVDRDQLFNVPNLLVLVDDDFYLFKPLRRRFWLSRTALSDADHIVKSVQAAAWDSKNQ